MSLLTNEILNDYDFNEARTLVSLIKTLNSSGHNPATSGNYSIRSQKLSDVALVSESGIDKSVFQDSNLLPVVVNNGKLYSEIEAGRKSSDETGIHLAIYQATDAKCVLHSHLLESILFADLFQDHDRIPMTGLELLKGLKGVKTHEAEVYIPVLANSQDIGTFSENVKLVLAKEDVFTKALLIRGHGFYVWGSSVKEAKRHLEVFEYLFKYFVERKRLSL